MSYQTLTDVIVNPVQLQDLQLSNPVKNSHNQTSSTNFADFLASYQTKESEKPVENQTSQNQNVKSNKNLDENSKPEEIKAQEEISKDDEVEKPENSEIKEEKEDVQVKDDKEKNISKNLKDKFKLDDKNVSQNKEKIQDKKITSSGKKEKKLSDKDFAKLNQLLDEESKIDQNDLSKLALNPNQKIPEDKNIQENENDNLLESLQVGETIPDNQITIGQNTEFENSEENLNFGEEKSEKRKTFALDKEGKITVEDLRTQVAEESELNKKSELKTTEIKQTSQNSATITMDLNQNANADVLSLNNQAAGSNASTFQQMLNNQIANNAPEFVKAGTLVLKDNNQGTINLLLHPDDLGNVKIHLSLDGKTVSAQITVASKEALQVFKDNAETLREAFIKNGFDAANFDVAFNNGSNGSFNQSMDFNGQNDGSNLFANKVYGSKSEALNLELENIIQNAEDISNYSVNIVA